MECSTTYVSRKIGAVKWLPQFYPDSSSGKRMLITGSVDDKANRLQMWSLNSIDASTAAMPSRNRPQATIPSPQLAYTHTQRASITQIEVAGSDRVVTSNSDGSLALFSAQHGHGDDVKLTQQHAWNNLHQFKRSQNCPCTSLSVSKNGEDVVTGGEDGRLNFLTLDDQAVKWSSGDGNGACINKVQYRTANEFFSVNALGLLQLWDTRANGRKALQTMRNDLAEGDAAQYQIHDVCVHPNQPNTVATGGGDGVLSVWDVRHPTFPISITKAHNAEIWQIKFHQRHPDKLYTASEDGQLLQWNTNVSQSSRKQFAIPADGNNLALTALVGSDQSCLGINTIDVETEYLAAGTDNEALLIFRC